MRVYTKDGERSLEEADQRIDRLEIRDALDKIIQATDLRSFAERYGSLTIAVDRARLHEILLSAPPREHSHI